MKLQTIWIMTSLLTDTLAQAPTSDPDQLKLWYKSVKKWTRSKRRIAFHADKRNCLDGYYEVQKSLDQIVPSGCDKDSLAVQEGMLTWSEWTNWSACVMTARFRSRKIRCKALRDDVTRLPGQWIYDQQLDKSSCSTEACGEWSECKIPAGFNGNGLCYGNSFQNRTCRTNIDMNTVIHSEDLASCGQTRAETRACVETSVPDEWSDWETCIDGVKTRFRDKDRCDASLGKDTQSISCPDNERKRKQRNSCYWTEWSPCSNELGGKRFRTKKCGKNAGINIWENIAVEECTFGLDNFKNLKNWMEMEDPLNSPKVVPKSALGGSNGVLNGDLNGDLNDVGSAVDDYFDSYFGSTEDPIDIVTEAPMSFNSLNNGDRTSPFVGSEVPDFSLPIGCKWSKYSPCSEFAMKYRVVICEETRFESDLLVANNGMEWKYCAPGEPIRYQYDWSKEDDPWQFTTTSRQRGKMPVSAYNVQKLTTQEPMKTVMPNFANEDNLVIENNFGPNANRFFASDSGFQNENSQQGEILGENGVPLVQLKGIRPNFDAGKSNFGGFNSQNVKFNKADPMATVNTNFDIADKLSEVNAGKFNSGKYNTGKYNSGKYNSGNQNSGTSSSTYVIDGYGMDDILNKYKVSKEKSDSNKLGVLKTGFQNSNQNTGNINIQPRDEPPRKQAESFKKPTYSIKTPNSGASNVNCYWNPNTIVEPCKGGQRVITYRNSCSGRSHQITTACK